jgi:hypothetical protein
MTFTLTALRTDVAADLRDATVIWTTAQLDRAISQALARYARVAPVEVTAALTGISLRTVDLSAATPGGLGATGYAALVRVVAVEYPISQYPPNYVRFDTFGATLSMQTDTVPAAAAVNVFYERGHTLDSSSGTIPDRDRELLATGAAGLALSQYATDAMETVNTQPDLVAKLRAMGAERVGRFDAGLAILAKRVRTYSLYRPNEPFPSRNTVQFPS